MEMKERREVAIGTRLPLNQLQIFMRTWSTLSDREIHLVLRRAVDRDIRTYAGLETLIEEYFEEVRGEQ